MLFIYKIFKPGDTNYYIGSCGDIKHREDRHKSACKVSQCGLYIYIRDNGGWDAFTMAVICECDDDRLGEQTMIRELQPALNTMMYDFDKVVYGKAYKEAHKEKLKEQNKSYYEANKAAIRAKQNKKCNCACGGKYTSIHKLRHAKSKKHQDYLESLNL